MESRTVFRPFEFIFDDDYFAHISQILTRKGRGFEERMGVLAASRSRPRGADFLEAERVVRSGVEVFDLPPVRLATGLGPGDPFFLA